MFVLTSNWFRKWFSGKLGVWLLLQIWSNWKAFTVDQKLEPKQQKIIFVFIFTSNDFQPWKIEERERERARRSPTSEQEDRIRARRSHRSDHSNPPLSNPVTDHQDHLAISGPRAKRETERVLRSSHRRTPTNPLAPTNPDEPTCTVNPLAPIHSCSRLKFL